MQISNPIQPGNSGGPLFNTNGEIVGIVVSTLNAKYFYENADIIPQNVNFAIKSDYLLNLITMLPEEKEIRDRNNKLKNISLESQVEIISQFIVNIRSK
jgi:serine protease Do